MTEDEKKLIQRLKEDTPLNRARAQFRYYYATMEQGQLQRVPLTPIEFVKLEFEAVEKIIKAYNGKT